MKFASYHVPDTQLFFLNDLVLPKGVFYVRQVAHDKHVNLINRYTDREFYQHPFDLKKVSIDGRKFDDYNSHFIRLAELIT